MTVKLRSSPSSRAGITACVMGTENVATPAKVSFWNGRLTNKPTFKRAAGKLWA